MTLKRGVWRCGQGHVAHFKFWGPNDTPGMVSAIKNRQILHAGRMYQILGY